MLSGQIADEMDDFLRLNGRAAAAVGATVVAASRSQDNLDTYGPAPELGADTDDVLERLGLGDAVEAG